MSNKRLDLIKEMLEGKDFVSVDEIAEKLEISLGTVRRDLIEMEDRKIAKRVHGGAVLYKGADPLNHIAAYRSSDYTLPYEFSMQIKTNVEAKQRIAKTAASFVEDGDSIYLDSSSSSFFMIDYLKEKKITAVTNGVPHLLKLADLKINTFALEGFIDSNRGAITLTDSSMITLSKLTFSKSFIGTLGVDFNFGYTTSSLKDSSLKQLILHNSGVAYVLGDSSKYGIRSLACFTKPEDVIFIGNDIPEKYKDLTYIKEAD
ncbi:MAG: DeoR/GlpR transcriptional regulator [Erysipelotrichaceae bacterium]|nr:DeoR/GlpR transcriptional regulator [Erysipelotrichaceae bacterium]